MNPLTRDASGYLPIEHYGIIGNMRTCALVSIDGSIGNQGPERYSFMRHELTEGLITLDFMCW